MREFTRAYSIVKAQPLEGVRVLVTRPKDPDSEFIRLLEEHGASVTSMPLIAIAAPQDERALQSAIDRTESFDWLLFTSVAGVESYAKRRRALPADKPRIAAVGPATARAVEATFGRSVALVPRQFSGEALADALLERAHKSGKVLVISAADARAALVARLRAGGMTVETVIAYSTVSVRPRDIDERIAMSDVVTLASPSAVHSLVHALGGRYAASKLRGKLIACIGPVTLFEARQAGLHVEVVPESTTTAALVEALCRYYSAQVPPR